ncbi:efflux transporter outer membrane subunit [Achromobacter aloeverae]|uniref:RND transporter n=1 Tax=Achromobacter aloeverae TaxID=1750518 RepID=A0A4Q1HJW7_9BURK|nr:efflux transporter outer membrane subunit [Achromobacter aloeverae]RXN90390.1 RND transporter [Achromobacter aloeverae]
MKHLQRFSMSLLTTLVLAGCSVTPTYERPAAPASAAFKEALPADQAGQWKTAQPAEDQLRGAWWELFKDEQLNRLEVQAQAANQSLKAAAARLAQARALQRQARSSLFPEVTANFGPTRQRASPASQGLADDGPATSSTLWRAQAGVSYEADLFGRVSSTVDAATADAQQSEALLRSVQLALQADVAQNYFQVRQLDAERQVYVQTLDLREQTLKLVERRYKEGDISELDVARARSELASAQSEALGIDRNRAAAEHALAVLLGLAPSEFSLPATPLARIDLRVPAGLPSGLLERRPDIAAAERAMAAANDRIGAARAAFFPQLNITGYAGYESSELGHLFQWSSRTFLLGPLTGAMLSLPIFDAGRRQAGLDRARAVYEEDVANYRQSVLGAFREVEDNLASLRILDDQIGAQDRAVQASSRAAQLSHTQYKEGSISYLDVIDSDRTVLAQQRISVQLDGARALSTVNLIRALGGGWSLPTPQVGDTGKIEQPSAKATAAPAGQAGTAPAVPVAAR